MATKEIKVNEFALHEHDTGSVEVQIARLTKDIVRLTEHAKQNPHDYSSKRGMIKLVSQRRKSLDYLQRKNPEQYRAIIQRLGIRK